MFTDWKHIPFDQLFEIPSRNGLTKPTRIRGEGTKMVNMGELFAYSRINDIHMDRVPLSEKEAKNYLLEEGDLLFARQSLVLAGAGKCSIFLGADEPVTYEGHIIRVRLNKRIADPFYYYYFFSSGAGRQLIESIIEQVAAAGIRGSDLAKLPVPCPPIEEQKRISSIIKSFDEKIELNRKMNQTLEELARAIFKSWFVDFDPVRAKAEGRPTGLPAEIDALFPDGFEESAVGEIPRGWRVTRIGEVAAINTKSIRKDFPCEEIDYIDISSVEKGRRTSTNLIKLSDAPSRAKRLVCDGDIIWSCVRPNRKSYLLINKADPKMVVSTGFAVLSSLLVPSSYLYAWVTTDDFIEYLTNNADGSAYPAVRPEHFSDAAILYPSEDVLRIYYGCVQPLLDLIWSNEQESTILVETRDSFLPILLNG